MSGVECVRALLNARADPMEASSRHLYADMNAQSTMGAFEIEDGKVEVDLIERAMQERYEDAANELAERVVHQSCPRASKRASGHERKDAARKEKERAKKQAKQRREQARQKASGGGRNELV